MGSSQIVGWPRLLRSETARLLVRRYSKGVTIAGTATTAATLVLSVIQDASPPDGPPRPPAELRSAITRIEPPATVTVAERRAVAAVPRPGPGAESHGTRPPPGPVRTRDIATGPRTTPVAITAAPRAAASIEPPTVSPALDRPALARTLEGPVEDTAVERHWTFGSSLRLARSAAESATSKVLEWKHRVTSSIGSLLDVLP